MFLLLIINLVSAMIASNSALSDRSFSISYENNSFIKDGHPYRFISGSIHYFRVPHQYWRDRLQKMKLAGLNTIQTYVEWSSHQPEENELIFSGDLDIEAFMEMAAELNLNVILRPGPYIDAERDLGGLPYWLLKNKDINLRSSDPLFLGPVARWFALVLGRLKKHLYKNGGPIIMVQLENEYGSYGCDAGYLRLLRDMILNIVGENVLLFATDGNSKDLVSCSKIGGVYATVDFGSGTNVSQAFNVQRSVQPKGPLVNSEYYSGWLDHWQYKHSVVPVESVVSTLAEMLEVGANVNIYMFHGGTSFGLKAGSNSNPFSSTPTSYDYDAPISECGDVGEKFWRIRELIGKYRELPPIPTNFKNVSEKVAYGDAKMRRVWSIFDGESSLFKTYGEYKYPPSFEDVSQSDGFLLYQTKIVGLYRDPSVLNIPGLADRAYIYINYQYTGLLSRGEEGATSIPLQTAPGDTISILVENQGRICFGAGLNDRKGIVGNVTLEGHNLMDWSVKGLSLDSKTVRLMHKLSGVSKKNRLSRRLGAGSRAGRLSLWSGYFQSMSNSVSSRSQIHDTFIKLVGWRKGVVIVNGVVLGRYWPIVGPQKTLYLPAPFIKHGLNSILVLEQEGTECYPNCTVQFITIPDINGPTPN